MVNIDFTYNAYRSLIQEIQGHGYAIKNYHNWRECKRCVIMRHDVDNDLEKALDLAKIEEQLCIKSTYFILVTSDFYNVFSFSSEKFLLGIMSCGHEIGLHFDEVRYSNIVTPEDARDRIIEETKLLSAAIGKPITTVSMHRPSKMMLDADLCIPGIINSYGHEYYKKFKYLSDSRRHWREPVEEIVASEKYDRLQILTHAIWYNENEKSIHDSIRDFINSGNKQRYIAEQSNITDLESVMTEDEVL